MSGLGPEYFPLGTPLLGLVGKLQAVSRSYGNLFAAD